MDVRDAAKLFIQLGTIQAESESGDGMTNLRVNKLLYFAQGDSLSKRKVPLFDDKIEAWDLGPVVPSIYHTYKGFKKNTIEDIPPSRENISDEEYMLLLDVYNAARSISTSGLVDISHEKGSPWYTVYHNNSDAGGEITQDSIRDYFIAHPFCKSSFSDTIKRLKQNAITIERDSNGVAIIPKEYANDWN